MNLTNYQFYTKNIHVAFTHSFKDICDGAVLYADLIHQKLISEGYYDDEGQFDITEPVSSFFMLQHCSSSIYPTFL